VKMASNLVTLVQAYLAQAAPSLLAVSVPLITQLCFINATTASSSQSFTHHAVPLSCKLISAMLNTFFLLFAVPGILGPWSEWSPCSASCGDTGVQSRQRLCSLPRRANPNKFPLCANNPVESKACDQQLAVSVRWEKSNLFR